MTKATKRGILAVVTVIVLLALGVGLGIVVGDALGIRTDPASQMDPAEPTAADAAVDAPEQAGEASLTVVSGGGDEADETYRLTGSASALRIEAASETGAV